MLNITRVSVYAGDDARIVPYHEGILQQFRAIYLRTTPNIDISEFHAGNHFAIATRFGKLIGSANLVEGQPNKFELHRIYVDESFERKGIGRRLVSALLRTAQNHRVGGKPITIITCPLRDANQFFQKIGFKPSGFMEYSRILSIAALVLVGVGVGVGVAAAHHYNGMQE